uniref:Uncharacterized protein n=1 Tax=Oryza barthii TaxID=65489 RepID=A0A0D3GW19_9ORYZ
MVADMAATKLATAADCGACRDAGPHQEPRRHEGGAAPSSMLWLCVPGIAGESLAEPFGRLTTATPFGVVPLLGGVVLAYPFPFPTIFSG